ncbi:uncharacterized protein LOC134252169, partial [Saccostrea cucullata]|uniref:uncharacterized protein LOC134252169 n=1 Tax=Saccostrea cuccullata TaxID=36930 RepID=UPI002ED0D78E
MQDAGNFNNERLHEKNNIMRNRTKHELPLILGLISSSVDGKDGKEDLKSTSPIKRAASGSVAFSAYMSNREPEPSPHHTFIFDSVLTNVGNGYNKHSGIFTAPHTVGASFTDAYDSTYTQTSNGLIAVEINEGDTVFIRTHPTNSNKGRITSNPVEHRTSFSGWKINLDEVFTSKKCYIVLWKGINKICTLHVAQCLMKKNHLKDFNKNVLMIIKNGGHLNEGKYNPNIDLYQTWISKWVVLFSEGTCLISLYGY